MAFKQWPLCQQKENKSCVFQRNNCRANKVVSGNYKICVLKHIKILGLICDSKLNWYYQTVNAIEKENKVKQALRIISKFFSTLEIIKLLNFGKHYQRF